MIPCNMGWYNHDMVHHPGLPTIPPRASLATAPPMPSAVRKRSETTLQLASRLLASISRTSTPFMRLEESMSPVPFNATVPRMCSMGSQLLSTSVRRVVKRLLRHSILPISSKMNSQGVLWSRMPPRTSSNIGNVKDSKSDTCTWYLETLGPVFGPS